MMRSVSRYADRRDAGRRLAAALLRLHDWREATVVALPRGGVPVAYEVALALRAPLDVVVVRKLGAPFARELAMGAVASGGVRILNREVVASFGISKAVIDETAERELSEVERRELAYRDGAAPASLEGRTAILVDDGLATGSSMRAAIASARTRGAARVVVAVPVGAVSTCEALAREADEVVCPLQPEMFAAVGEWYDDFTQVADEEVRRLLAGARRRQPED